MIEREFSILHLHGVIFGTKGLIFLSMERDGMDIDILLLPITKMLTRY